MRGVDRFEFGERRDDLEYEPRPGSYGLVVEDSRVLTVEEGSGLFLPGGGHEADESPVEALHREFLEETGFEVAQAERLAVADEFFLYRPGRGMRKECHLYRVELGVRRREPTETECPSRWLSDEAAADELYHEAFRWLVEKRLLSES